MSRLRSMLVGVALGGPLYWLLIDTVDTPELYAGGAATLLAAGVYEISYSQGYADAAFRSSWIAELGRALARVPRGIFVVACAIVAQTLRPQAQRGWVRTSHYRAGDENDPLDLGRRALKEALGSVAPDSFVIGIDPDRDELVVHEFR